MHRPGPPRGPRLSANPHVPLAAAARELGRSPAALRRWVREEGCPAIVGGPGRGFKGYHVDLDAVRAWLGAKAPQSREAELQQLADLALDFWRRGAEAGALERRELGHRLLGIPDPKAAALLCFFLQYVAVRLKLPVPEAPLLEAIVRQGNVHGVSDSVQGTVNASTNGEKATC